jgi:hypothetical protein
MDGAADDRYRAMAIIPNPDERPELYLGTHIPAAISFRSSYTEPAVWSFNPRHNNLALYSTIAALPPAMTCSTVSGTISVGPVA